MFKVPQPVSDETAATVSEGFSTLVCIIVKGVIPTQDAMIYQRPF